MQQLIVENSQAKFLEEVNALMMDGWQAVPGTTLIVGMAMVAFPDQPTRYALPDGTTRVVKYSIVLERDDVR